MAVRAGASIRELSVTLHPLSQPDPAPLGDMPLAPFAMTKRTEADLAQAMVEHLRDAAPPFPAPRRLERYAGPFRIVR